MIDSALSFLAGLPGRIGSFLVSLPGEIFGAFASGVGWLTSGLSDIGETLLSPVVSAVDSLKSELKDKLDGVIDTLGLIPGVDLGDSSAGSGDEGDGSGGSGSGGLLDGLGLPTPDFPGVSVPTPDIPTPDVSVPTPDIPTPDIPTPDVSVPTPELPGVGDVFGDLDLGQIAVAGSAGGAAGSIVPGAGTVSGAVTGAGVETLRQLLFGSGSGDGDGAGSGDSPAGGNRSEFADRTESQEVNVGVSLSGGLPTLVSEIATDDTLGGI
jgi:hypothetical protein